MVNFGELARIDDQSRRVERRQVTVMSCELVSEIDTDAEAVSCQLERYRAQVVRCVSQHGGLIISDIGGSILAVWGSSGTAGGDYDAETMSPHTALLVALELAGHQYPAARIKIALDAGIVVVSHNAANGRFGDLVGRVVSDACALRMHADHHTVIVSDAVRWLTANAFMFEPIDISDATGGCGLPKTWPRVWHVMACKQHQQLKDRRAPRLVGNVGQRTALDQALAAVLVQGRQVVVITGEAGIGKSALFRHFRVRVRASQALWIEATCRPEYAHATLQPIPELLRHALPQADIDWLLQTTPGDPTGYTPSLPPLAALEAADHSLLGRFLGAHVGGGPTNRVLTAQVTGRCWPSDRQHRLFDVLIDIIAYVAAQQPTFIAIEDLHWADRETLEFLALLVERSTRWRQFGIVLVARRHDHLPKRMTQRAAIIAVQRMSDSEIVDLLNGAETNQAPLSAATPVSDRPLPPDILRRIAQRSEGVPLFAEQLAALYLKTANPEQASAILASPTSLNLTLAARLDALGDYKSLAQTASILGRDFDQVVLAGMLNTTTIDLRTGIDALVASGLVTSVTDRRHVSHRFSHALVRDAAYASLLKQRRRQLHAQAANTITKHFADLAQTTPETIAQHYTEAGVGLAAAHWWRMAAERALCLSQLSVAVSHLQRGLGLLDAPVSPAASDATMPDSDHLERDEELAIRRLLGPCLTMLIGNGADAVIANYRRCLELTKGRAPTPFDILWGLQGCHSVRGELADALVIGDQAIAVAETSQTNGNDVGSATSGDEQCLLAHRMQGLTCMQAGDIGKAMSHYKEVQRRYNPERHEMMRFRYASDQGALAQAHWAWAEAVAGNFAASEQLAEQALTRADQLEHPHTSAHVVAVLAARAQTLQQREVAAPLALAARSLAQAHGFTYWSAWAEIILGWHEAGHSPENSILRIERAIQDYRRTGAGQALPYAMLLKAEIALEAGLSDLAIRTTTEGLKLARDGGIGLYIGELLRVQAQALIQSMEGLQRSPGHGTNYETSVHRAAQLALAEAMTFSLQQGTRIFAMRAAVTQLRCFPVNLPAHRCTMAASATAVANQHAATVLRYVLAAIGSRATPVRSPRSAEVTAAMALAAKLEN
jgi:class 3 adenylate cyclase/tetratricopeptide (TPR) repeat protein